MPTQLTNQKRTGILSSSTNKELQLPSVISNSPPVSAFDAVFDRKTSLDKSPPQHLRREEGKRKPRRRSSFTRSTNASLLQRLLILTAAATIIITVILSHNKISSSEAFPLPPPSSLQNWWFSKVRPPPPPPPPEKPENFDEFELIKPRLLMLADSNGFENNHRPSYQNSVPSINTRRQSTLKPSSSSSFEGQTESKKPTFLLTFFTRDQTAYRAELTEDKNKNEEELNNNSPATTSNPYSENSVIIEDDEGLFETPKTLKNKIPGCRHFHGHLVTPSRGYLAASSCPQKSSSKESPKKDLLLSATIMLTTGKVLLIRPLISSNQEPLKESRSSEPNSEPPSLKAYAIGRRRFTTQIRPSPLNSKGSNGNRSNCYMSEYEKRHISLEIVAAKQTTSITAEKTTQNPLLKETASDKEERQKQNEGSRYLWQKHSSHDNEGGDGGDDHKNHPNLHEEGEHELPINFPGGQKLVHQYGQHYLYRVAAESSKTGGGTGKINENAFFPTITLKSPKKSNKTPQNYSSCTERYIEPTSVESFSPPPAPTPETVSPSVTPTNNPYSDDYEDEDYKPEEDNKKPEKDYSDDLEDLKDLEDHQDQRPSIKVQHRSSRRRRRRRKRELTKDDVYSKTFTIETVIFVDRPLLERFNGDRHALQRLILAIMNEVQLIFNFDSLRIRVRILIKAIRFLENGKEAPPTAEGDIDQYLDNFCAWQRRLWVGANRTARWDHALMLTGLDLYKRVGSGNKKNRKVLGLAWVNGMCRPAYSCTLNEGKNFEAAYVIAHEMAHSLGMLHDGYDNNCDPERYIMSEKTGPGKINWSPCSNLYLENFLTKSNMRCLETTRAELGSGGPGGRRKQSTFLDPFDAATDTRLPGEQYSLNEQCELALGKGYRAYTSAKAPFQDVCRELWCSSGTWATPAHPALEGSVCSRRKSCYQGGCVDKQRAFAQSKIKMFDNRRPTDSPPPGRLSVSGGGGGSGSSASNGSGGGGGGGSGSFMRRVQRFLRNTIRSVVGFFG